jgi:hypothetical protein
MRRRANSTIETKTKERARVAKSVLGWRDWLSIPELGITRIKVKVDTGARSSSMHAEQIEVFERDGTRFVGFELEHSAAVILAGPRTRLELPLFDLRWITSSNGNRQKRPIIRIAIDLGGQSWPVDMSLGPRGNMGFPMLLGREAVRRRFVVDPGRAFVAKDHVPLTETQDAR